MLHIIQAVLSIALLDLVLSGDNAVVIGMASRLLPPRERRRAIFFGALGAVGLRVLFTALVAVLLGIPLLEAIGGVLLIWIAFKLVTQGEHEHSAREGANLLDAVRTIILADVIMSLDNVLAVGGAAHGNLVLLLFGLALSIPLILFGSGLVARVMNRLPCLMYVGAAILLYTGVDMVLHDPVVARYHALEEWGEWVLIGVLVAAVLYAGRRSSAHKGGIA